LRVDLDRVAKSYNILYVEESGEMDQVSYTELRQNLKKHMDGVCDSRAPLVVTR